MKKLSCLIADDEKLAREILRDYVGKVDLFGPVGECANAAEVLVALAQQPIDVLFLDIQMPGMTGMELLRSSSALPLVILTTAYSDFALEAFQFQVIDYLLKPIAFERFARAMHKLAAYTHAAPAFPAETRVTPTHPAGAFMYVRSEKKMVKIRFDDILWIEGMKDYVVICETQRKTITYTTLGAMEEKLPAHLFRRIHRSFIVSLHNITAYTQRSVEIGEHALPIGEFYQKSVLAWLDINH